MRYCSIADCLQPHMAVGLCNKHYLRQQRREQQRAIAARSNEIDQAIAALDALHQQRAEGVTRPRLGRHHNDFDSWAR